ncbi:ATP cone domain-containing protein [Patescibacteria group bacterium]
MKKTKKIEKRDKTQEDFDRKKINQVVIAAGLSNSEADLVSENVEAWVNSLNEDLITSLQVKDKVLEELKKVNSYVASLFDWYEKTKEAEKKLDG